MRILFVDDERRVLEGVRDLLRRHRREWDMIFAVGPEEALTQLSAGPFDIIVTDLRMPGIDGAELLHRVHAEHPDTIRIVLSGHAELRSAMSAVSVTHQYLGKPIGAEELQRVIERACGLHRLLDDPVLRRVVGRMRGLPSRPQIYDQLCRALADPEVPVERIAPIIEQDVAISADMLRLVNSAYFSRAQRISSVRGAVSFLGTASVKHLVLAIEMTRDLAPAEGAQLDLEAVQIHSLRAGRLAERIAADSGDPRLVEHAALAGLLHDAGLLLLGSQAPGVLVEAIAVARAGGGTLCEAERAQRGVTHAEVGAYLLGLWDFPCDVVEAVATHHAPLTSPGLTLPAVVQITDALLPGPLGPDVVEGSVDLASLEAVGGPGRLGRWRELAAQIDENRRI